MQAHEILPKVQELYLAGEYEAADHYAAALEVAERGRPAGQRRFLQRALRARGVVAVRRGRAEQALRCFEEALALDPSDADAHFSLALYYLIRGDYGRGFAEYEWRLNRPNCVAPDMARAPLWDGAPIPQGTLLVHCEQGAGDAIQFIRLLPLVRERVGALYLACHNSLFRLFEKLEAPTRVFSEEMSIPAHDFQLPLLSIPHRLGLGLAGIPARVPYLDMPAAPFPPLAGRKPRIGVVWRAKPHEGEYRSAPLDALLPLFALPAEWVSLQKETTAPERELLAAHGVAEAGSGFADFHATAEAIQGLDLVISVDTAVAHLTGALGRPGWVLLPKWAEWRWLLDRADSPWYPTLTLFRQAADRDWSGSVAAAAARLREEAGV